jgi:hypothetical protein
MIESKKPLKVRAKASSTAKSRVAATTLPSVALYVSEFTVGDDVKHPQFGAGVILEITDDKLQIRFADDHQRQVLDYYVVRT